MRITRDAVWLVALGRVGIGLGMLARPRLLPAVVGVDSGTAARVSWVVRMLGVREVVLGAGALAALRRGADARDWVLAQAVSDAVDSAAFAGAVARGHAHRVTGSLFACTGAAAAAVQGVSLAGERGE
ncbi:MAG TPA: hypothetical protein VFQ85_14945 [Mycobacteriales bacterium]|jgi:hypothetical protein|nr:hypothetical protein [Mycobacteriales bacterium]